MATPGGVFYRSPGGVFLRSHGGVRGGNASSSVILADSLSLSDAVAANVCKANGSTPGTNGNGSIFSFNSGNRWSSLWSYNTGVWRTPASSGFALSAYVQIKNNPTPPGGANYVGSGRAAGVYTNTSGRTIRLGFWLPNLVQSDTGSYPPLVSLRLYIDTVSPANQWALTAHAEEIFSTTGFSGVVITSINLANGATFGLQCLIDGDTTAFFGGTGGGADSVATSTVTASGGFLLLEVV